MDRRVLVWGYFSSFILLLGAIFMNLYLVAGKVLYLIGFFAFNIGYLIPLFFVIFQRNQENKIGVVIVLGVLGFLLFLTGVSFFVVNWVGGIALIYIGGGVLVLAILAIIFMARRFYETHIDSWFPILVFGVFIVVSLLTGMVHRQVMRVFSVSNKDMVLRLNVYKETNNKLCEDFMALDSLKYPQFDSISQNIALLRNDIEAVNEHIEEVKVVLFNKVKRSKLTFFQERGMENLVPVQANVEINAVNRIMLRRKKGKARLLKIELMDLREAIFQMIPKDETLLYDFVETNLNTESYELDRRLFNRSWEHQNFYDFPIITVINQLTNIQLKTRTVESEMLHFYYKEYLLQSKMENANKSY